MQQATRQGNVSQFSAFMLQLNLLRRTVNSVQSTLSFTTKQCQGEQQLNSVIIELMYNQLLLLNV